MQIVSQPITWLQHSAFRHLVVMKIQPSIRMRKKGLLRNLNMQWLLVQSWCSEVFHKNDRSIGIFIFLVCTDRSEDLVHTNTLLMLKEELAQQLK